MHWTLRKELSQGLRPAYPVRIFHVFIFLALEPAFEISPSEALGRGVSGRGKPEDVSPSDLLPGTFPLLALPPLLRPYDTPPRPGPRNCQPFLFRAPSTGRPHACADRLTLDRCAPPWVKGSRGTRCFLQVWTPAYLHHHSKRLKP